MSWSKSILALLALLACGAPEEGGETAIENSGAADWRCEALPESDTPRIRRLEGEEGLVLEPDPGLGRPAAVWEGELNGDARPDLLLRFPESCGNWGECLFAAYAGCGGDRFAPVWGPGYAFDLEVAEEADPAGGWRRLRQIQRYEEGAAARTGARELVFAGGAYRPAEGSRSR